MALARLSSPHGKLGQCSTMSNGRNPGPACRIFSKSSAQPAIAVIHLTYLSRSWHVCEPTVAHEEDIRHRFILNGLSDGLAQVPR